jgi:hypothetical protein
MRATNGEYMARNIPQGHDKYYASVTAAAKVDLRP